MVFDMNIVRVKEGQETLFQELRDQMMINVMNSDNVVAAYKFNVEPYVLETFYGMDLTNVELSMAVYDSEEARTEALAELGATEDFVSFVETFDCIMCAAMTGMVEMNRPEYFPPFA